LGEPVSPFALVKPALLLLRKLRLQRARGLLRGRKFGLLTRDLSLFDSTIGSCALVVFAQCIAHDDQALRNFDSVCFGSTTPRLDGRALSLDGPLADCRVLPSHARGVGDGRSLG